MIEEKIMGKKGKINKKIKRNKRSNSKEKNDIGDMSSSESYKINFHAGERMGDDER